MYSPPSLDLGASLDTINWLDPGAPGGNFKSFTFLGLFHTPDPGNGTFPRFWLSFLTGQPTSPSFGIQGSNDAPIFTREFSGGTQIARGANGSWPYNEWALVAVTSNGDDPTTAGVVLYTGTASSVIAEITYGQQTGTTGTVDDDNTYKDHFAGGDSQGSWAGRVALISKIDRVLTPESGLIAIQNDPIEALQNLPGRVMIWPVGMHGGHFVKNVRRRNPYRYGAYGGHLLVNGTIPFGAGAPNLLVPRPPASPLVVLAAGQTISVGQALETDTAFGITPLRTHPIGLASEADTANAMVAERVRAISLASEADTATVMAHSKAVNAGLASEADTAQPIIPERAHALGLAAEVDTATVMAHAKALNLALATEIDTAQPIASGAAVAVGLATETDTATAMAHARALAVGLAAEADTAQGITPERAHALGLASEADSGQPIVFNKSRTISIGLASEADTAFAVGLLKTISLGLATEIDTAFPVVAVGPSAFVVGNTVIWEVRGRGVVWAVRSRGVVWEARDRGAGWEVRKR